jgi:hypothetical protein
MAGSKKNKLKKGATKTSDNPPPTDQENEDLVNDLLAHLDSREASAELAAVQSEPQSKQRVNAIARSSAKIRFKARQVCRSLSSVHHSIT